MKKPQGQTLQEVISGLENLKTHGMIFTKYTLTALTPDGKQKLTIGYDIKNDERFSKGKS